MKMSDVREKARKLGVIVGVGMSKLDAVRAIQRAEGYEDCFGRGLHERCGQPDCCFRSDCAAIH